MKTAIYYLYSVPACQEIYENCCSVKCIEVSKLSDEERLKLRKGVENKRYFIVIKK